MKEKIIASDWNINQHKKYLRIERDNFIVDNTSNDKIVIKCSKVITKPKNDIKKCFVVFNGNLENSGGYLCINDTYNVPINSESNIPVSSLSKIRLSIVVPANSKIEIKELSFDFDKNEDLVDNLEKKNKVLVIVPEYPSYVNLYYCAFAHSRNKEYVKNGLNIQVFAVNPGISYQTKYEKDNIPVVKGSYKDLKRLLTKHQYSVIVTHFVDEYLFSIFDGNVYENQKLIFICHGPETVYRYLVNKVRPYFTKPQKEPIVNDTFDLKDFYVKKYSQKENVEWVFVSDWLKEFSEEQQNLKFKHSRVINNIIDEDLFPYKKKNKEDRKKILLVRKFDNICQHSIDQVVYAILELSRKSYFKELEFDIYGDGNFYDTLIAPIKDFENVHLYRRFIPNEKLNDVYKDHGIMLLPSRHDAHAVSMGESASTGLVVIGSRVTSNPYFMNEKENHTLSDPEDFKELAGIIERLYKNPDEFLKISKNMADFTRQFNKKNTVMKEINLIKDSLKEYKEKLSFVPVKPVNNPVLTIGIPAYNVDPYIEKCLVSILKCRNASKIEVLVINDGSKDETAKIVSHYEKLSNKIVRLINKENGGHGSTINRAIKEAKGKYFRLIDGDDWVDHENLAKLVDIMEKSNSDVILTKGSYDYVEEALLRDIIPYDNLTEGVLYNFEDLTYENYGFGKYGPLLTTGNYKTKILKDSKFTISEKKPYVDMEFNAFSIRLVNTLTYYNLDIYRYLIGREGQTISPEYWKKKYKDHESIIFSILDYLNTHEYSDRKKYYVLNKIIASMVDSQVYMLDAICNFKEIDVFLSELKEKNQEAYDISIKYINDLNGNCALILKKYKSYIKKNSKKSIIIPGVCENIEDYNRIHGLGTNISVKKVAKAVLPYGVVQLIRRRRQQ